jgi:hypothetical protein
MLFHTHPSIWSPSSESALGSCSNSWVLHCYDIHRVLYDNLVLFELWTHPNIFYVDLCWDRLTSYLSMKQVKLLTKKFSHLGGKRFPPLKTRESSLQRPQKPTNRSYPGWVQFIPDPYTIFLKDPFLYYSVVSTMSSFSMSSLTFRIPNQKHYMYSLCMWNVLPFLCSLIYSP